jgi:hypothetical protein
MEVLKLTGRAKRLSWFLTASSAIAMCLFTSWALTKQSVPSREYQLKAVFLYNFTQFTTWSAHSFSESNSPLVIGVLGNNPFGSYLAQTVKGEKVDDHPLVVKYYKKPEDTEACHILFVNLSKEMEMKDVLENLKHKSTLTVGDAPYFIAQGGMIQFVTQDHKIRMKINLEAAKEADLTFSAKLLRLADVVN